MTTFKYSDIFFRNAIMFWPIALREQWGQLVSRLHDDRPGIHPLDAEADAYEIIRAKIVKSKQDDPSLDLKALGFGDPGLVETPDLYFPDRDRLPIDLNGYTQSWWDDDGLVGYFIDPMHPAYRTALADEAERFAKATTGEKKPKPKPQEGPSLALTPDMESRVIPRSDRLAAEPVAVPEPVPIELVPDPVVPPVKVIRIDPNVCKQPKVKASRKPPTRGKGKHDKGVGTFNFGE